MRGPEIIARTMSVATARGSKRGGSAWQYHSRSDHHSKLACWALMFDLLQECDVLRKAAADGRIAFAVNHAMVGPINKTLDMVVTLADAQRAGAPTESFAGMADQFGIRLSEDDRLALQQLPSILMVRKDDASEVVIALEAKACMTEHVKSIPRLHARILAASFVANSVAPGCLTALFMLVNASDIFCMPGASGKMVQHKQPDDAARVIEMLSHAVPLMSERGGYGYDAIGATVIVCRNDSSPVRVIASESFANIKSPVHYDRMVYSIGSAFRRRYATTMM